MWLKFLILFGFYIKISAIFYPPEDESKTDHLNLRFENTLLRDAMDETEHRDNFLDTEGETAEDQVTFFLYHKSNFKIENQLFIDDRDALDKSRFDSRLESKFIIHGWTHGKYVPWVIEMREAMANLSMWNIIVVDWAPLSHQMYTEARVYTPLVGKQLGKFCMFLAKYKHINMSSIHLIGHSMGGQISAVAGHMVQNKLGQSLGRITGLDPASPLYELPYRVPDHDILDKEDADFVDVIHTNGRHLGMIGRAGHLDYYPNGGIEQPGCTSWVCSHIKACEFWTASVKNPNLFKAYPYKSWLEYLEYRQSSRHPQPVPMGFAASPRIPEGAYYFETGSYIEGIYSETSIFDSF